MANRPVLDDLELELVQKIDSQQDQDLVESGVPGLDFDFLASEGRYATRFTLTGVVTGAEAKDSLKKLREKFAIAQPVPFVTDIATATKVDKVLIEEMGVRELHGRPERFEYSFTLREFKPAPPPEEIIIPPPPPPVRHETCIEVTVIVVDDPDFDFSNVTVTVTGTAADGTAVNITLPQSERTGNRWRHENVPPGVNYTAQATTSIPEQMTGSSTFNVEADVCPNPVTITLRRGVHLGNTYIIHYRFDKAFIEPCLREVLAEVVERARSGPADEKIIIVGHTDEVGSDVYNQSLSERRARGVFAFLTYGLGATAAVDEWDELRKPQITSVHTINDNWGTRQIQYMLQDLNFYNDRIDGQNGAGTIAAVKHFQQTKGLPPTGVVDAATWRALIDAYMKQDSFAVPPSKFLDNCPPQILKWVGCSLKDPVINTPDARRENRRTEIIFARVAKLPCEVPQPVTFDLPAPGVVGTSWCLGPGDPSRRCCFLRRAPDQADDSHILVQPAHAATITHIHGRIRFEDGSPAANMHYVLIAPDGEFMDGEFPSGPQRGTPHEGVTNANGEFDYQREQKPKSPGEWIMEVQASVLARLEGEPPSAAKGNVVCKRMDGSSDFNVILTKRPTSFSIVDASNVDRKLSQVVLGQPFLIRADIPGETRDEITVELDSYLIRR